MFDARVWLLGLTNDIIEMVGAVRGGDINSKYQTSLWLSSEDTTLEVGNVLIESVLIEDNNLVGVMRANKASSSQIGVRDIIDFDAGGFLRET